MKDTELLANCTCLNLRKAARAVTKMYDEALKPSGLRATQLSILAVVEDKGPIGVTDLAGALVTDRTTLTRNLKPLLKQKLLKVAVGDDRRQRPVALTSKGQGALIQAVPLWIEAQRRMVDNLGRARWENLLSDLSETVSQVHTK